MRFLCLHGMGTNSRIFEIQTAAIRYGLGGNNEFEYVEGVMPATMAPGVDMISDPNDEYLQYADHEIPGSYTEALDNLERYVEEQGPFDGVMAFSQGAGLAAALLVRKKQKQQRGVQAVPIFRFAIFFCGGVPWDPSVPEGDPPRLMSFDQDGEVINIPTAHIWGAKDSLYPTFGPVLSSLCSCDQKDDYVHQGGHEIPGPKDQEGVSNAIRVIKRAIQRANDQLICGV